MSTWCEKGCWANSHWQRYCVVLLKTSVRLLVVIKMILCFTLLATPTIFLCNPGWVAKIKVFVLFLFHWFLGASFIMRKGKVRRCLDYEWENEFVDRAEILYLSFGSVRNYFIIRWTFEKKHLDFIAALLSKDFYLRLIDLRWKLWVKIVRDLLKVFNSLGQFWLVNFIGWSLVLLENTREMKDL